MNLVWKAHLSLIVVALIYGANYSIAKVVLDPKYIGPNGFILMRIWSAAILFLLFFGKPKAIERKDYGLLFICAISGVLCNQLFFFNGLALTSPIHASLIMVCTPILVLILLSFQGKHLSKKNIIGSGLGFIGAAWLVLSNHDSDESKSSFWGDIYVWINALSYAFYLTKVFPLIHKYGAAEIMKWIFIISGVICIPFGLSDILRTEWSILPQKAIWALIFVLVFTSFLAYALNAYALKISHATLVSNYIYLQPFLACLIAIMMGIDMLQWEHIGIGALILGGVFLSNQEK